MRNCWLFHRWGKWQEAERHNVTVSNYIHNEFGILETDPNTNEPLLAEREFVRILQARTCERCGLTKIRKQEAR